MIGAYCKIRRVSDFASSEQTMMGLSAVCHYKYEASKYIAVSALQNEILQKAGQIRGQTEYRVGTLVLRPMWCGSGKAITALWLGCVDNKIERRLMSSYGASYTRYTICYTCDIINQVIGCIIHNMRHKLLSLISYQICMTCKYEQLNNYKRYYFVSKQSTDLMCSLSYLFDFCRKC